MKRKTKKKLLTGISLLVVFALWTIALRYVDVKAIGPHNSVVGFAAVNGLFHVFTGVDMLLYTITDWLGLVPFFTAFGFAALGLCQWIARKHILKVDNSILLLGVFYLVVIGVYLFFEKCIVNYRPVLINNFLEASYPSSTTLLTLCVMPTTALQMRKRIQNTRIRYFVVALIYAFTVFVILGRLVSGVHWLSDIIGAVLLCIGLVLLYDAACETIGE